MTPEGDPRLLVNLGSGHPDSGRLPGFFANWRQLRVDVDVATHPDVVASLTDLSSITSGSAAAVWASHCLEHLYQHEVAAALREILRLLSSTGFVCIRVPDLQTIARHIADDRMHEVIYTSPAGPVTPHDVVFGFGADIAAGRLSMAHRTGFTPTLMVECLKGAGYESFVVRRTKALELVVLARRGLWTSEREPSALFDALAQ